mmetsp:Transcript_99449/g.172629  ORF Transcript_99449/g.172629 Transcript_99449/m.172629 type:complete len:388 (+) Transcript_99449:71-1234(+)
MPRFLVFILSALAAASEASQDALPTLEHQRILGYLAHEHVSSAFQAEEISLIQVHAQARGARQVSGLTSLKDPDPDAGTSRAKTQGAAEVPAAGPVLSKQQSAEEKDRVLRQRLLVAAGLCSAAIFVASFFCYLFDPSENDGENTDENSLEVRRNEQLPADTLGFLVCSIVRDSEHIALKKPRMYTHMSRIVIALCIISLNYLLQVYLFSQILIYIVPEDVTHIRQNYEKYEKIMYEDHTRLSVNGEHRGLEGFFNREQFGKLDDDLKGEMCSTPWSQPWFFVPLLFIWTCSCAREIKHATDLIHLLLVRMPTVDSMEFALHSVTVTPSGPGDGQKKEAMAKKRKCANCCWADTHRQKHCSLWSVDTKDLHFSLSPLAWLPLASCIK